MRICLCVCLALTALIATGCGSSAEGESSASTEAESKTTTDRGGVAVIDLDMLARQLGKQEEMDKLLKNKRMEFSQHLATVQAKYEKHIAAKKKEYGETPNVDQLNTLNSIRQTAAFKYSQEQQAVAIGIERYRLELIKELRAQVKPVAEKIANDRGFDVVIPRDQSLLLIVRKNADITAEVIAAMKKNGPKPLDVPKNLKPAPMPPKK